MLIHIFASLRYVPLLDEQDAVILQTVTKEEVIECFKKFVDPSSPSRAKISVHVKPQNPPPRRLSLQAAQAFAQRLQEHNIAVDTEEFLHLSESLPPISAVKAHMSAILLGDDIVSEAILGDVQPSAGAVDARMPSDPDVGRLLLEELEALGRQYPAEGEGDVQLNKAVEYITGDASVFKAGLRLSDPPRPVEEFHDLPVSRF